MDDVGQYGAWRADMPALEEAGQTTEEGDPNTAKQKCFADGAMDDPCRKKEGMQ